MPNKFEHAGGIAMALAAAERSANQTMIKMLAVGTALFQARQSDEFHNLECQRGVEFFGNGIAKLTEGLGDIARAHREVVETAVKHQIMASGDLCPLPDPGTPHGSNLRAVELAKAA